MAIEYTVQYLLFVREEQRDDFASYKTYGSENERYYRIQNNRPEVN